MYRIPGTRGHNAMIVGRGDQKAVKKGYDFILRGIDPFCEKAIGIDQNPISIPLLAAKHKSGTVQLHVDTIAVRQRTIPLQRRRNNRPTRRCCFFLRLRNCIRRCLRLAGVFHSPRNPITAISRQSFVKFRRRNSFRQLLLSGRDDSLGSGAGFPRTIGEKRDFFFFFIVCYCSGVLSR